MMESAANAVEMRIGDLSDEVVASVIDSIVPYSVLLLYHGKFAGSGTLIHLGNVFGILTAQHVPEKQRFNFNAGSTDQLGLCIDEKVHRFNVPLDHVERVDIGVPVSSEEGPDITFLRIPEGNHLSLLRAKKSFWNLGYQRGQRLEMCRLPKGALCLSYHVDERTEVLSNDERDLILNFRSSIGWSGARRTYEMHGFDYTELGLGPPNAEKGVPDSFGGASGGGVWKVPMSINKAGEIKTGSPILAGLLYYQTSRRTLLAHGPASIYERLFQTLTLHC